MNGPGAIGRTHAGKRLDAYIAALPDRTLRRRAYRTCGHIDRDFRGAMLESDSAGEWYRGFLYNWWNTAEFKKRFPRQRHAELRELLEDYSDSLFEIDYQPQTSTQLALQRSAQRAEEEKWIAQKKKAEDSAMLSLGGIVAVFLMWALTDSPFVRICLWLLFAINMLNLAELDEVVRRRPATLVDPIDPAQSTPLRVEDAKQQPSALA
jgi:hypothetical protein